MSDGYGVRINASTKLLLKLKYVDFKKQLVLSRHVQYVSIICRRGTSIHSNWKLLYQTCTQSYLNEICVRHRFQKRMAETKNVLGPVRSRLQHEAVTPNTHDLTTLPQTRCWDAWKHQTVLENEYIKQSSRYTNSRNGVIKHVDSSPAIQQHPTDDKAPPPKLTKHPCSISLAIFR